MYIGMLFSAAIFLAGMCAGVFFYRKGMRDCLAIVNRGELKAPEPVKAVADTVQKVRTRQLSKEEIDEIDKSLEALFSYNGDISKIGGTE